MDYRKFLGKTETLVLPSFGGAYVEAPGRRIRVAARVLPGWWRFEVSGRIATPLAQAEPEGSVLEPLERVRGHLLGDRLVRHGAVAEPLFFLPDDEPQRFSPAVARRWPTGQLVFEAVDFEGEVEELARRALQDGGSLAGLRGVPATLRAAFGYAVMLDVARRRGVPLSPAEVAGRVVEIAERDDGRTIAEGIVNFLLVERARAAARPRPAAAPVAVAQRAPRKRWHNAEERVADALAAAGAELLDTRNLAGGQLEVTYRFRGERFLTIVDRESLRVVDAGICLAGYDERVTLESLPGVIRQAIDEHRLVITRRDGRDAPGRYHWEREHVPDPDA